MNKILRSMQLTLVFFMFGIGALTIGFIIFPLINIFSQNKKEHYSNVIHSSWRFFLNLLIKLRIINIKIDNLDKIKNIKNSVIVSTHPSYIDVLIIMAIIPKTTCFVAPKVTKNIFFKNIANSMFLSRGDSVEELVENSKKALDEGFNVLIFPMGTRHKKDEYPKIKKGASLIALKAKKNIFPLKMFTDTNFLQINQPFYDAGEKTVEYELSLCEVIDTNEIIKNIDDEVTAKKEITKRIKFTLYDK